MGEFRKNLLLAFSPIPIVGERAFLKIIEDDLYGDYGPGITDAFMFRLPLYGGYAFFGSCAYKALREYYISPFF